MNIKDKVIEYELFKRANLKEGKFQINDSDYQPLLNDDSGLFETVLNKAEQEVNEILEFDNDKNAFYNSIELDELFRFRKSLIGIESSFENIDFFTITSKRDFISLIINDNENEKEWKESILYTPLNDHSREYLKKGDILFCYRSGQFSNLSEALDIRGIYGVGIALTEPQIFFPDRDKYNQYAIVVCFPNILNKHLSIRNIQMNPVTIDLTPYNGNRNDALQGIWEKEKAIELLKMICFENPDVKIFINEFYNFEVPEIDILPENYLNLKYRRITLSEESTEEDQSPLQIFSPLESPENVIYYGAPGTGKSFKVNQKIKDIPSKFYERVTFHPEYDNLSFIGGYKPVSEKNNEGLDEIKYKFVPQAFINIYENAWIDPSNQYYLIIEEINRGNCAEIFGDIFQLLDRKSSYTISPSVELKKYLSEKFGSSNHEGIICGIKLPDNLTILATMNTSDQSLFPMDSAFKRRWRWEYVPICYNDTDEYGNSNISSRFLINLGEKGTFKWIDFIEKINLNHIKINPNLGMDKCLGNYFIEPEENNVINYKSFISKVLFYLWNDVFKDEENSVFEDNTSYEDFFPIESLGKDKLIELLDRISVEISSTE